MTNQDPDHSRDDDESDIPSSSSTSMTATLSPRPGGIGIPHMSIPVLPQYADHAYPRLASTSSAFFPPRESTIPRRKLDLSDIDIHSPSVFIKHDDEVPYGTGMGLSPINDIAYRGYASHNTTSANLNARSVIDLTASPSPPPHRASMHSHQLYQHPHIPQHTMSMPPPPPPPQNIDDPKRPACIGQITATALVLYPIPYLSSSPLAQSQSTASQNSDWVPVRLRYDPRPASNSQSQNIRQDETIHISTPPSRSQIGPPIAGEQFGIVEQKVATVLGPMMGKGLVRCDAKVLRGKPNMPILPLQIVLFTPQGNIHVIGPHLFSASLFLNHPSPPFDMAKLHSSKIIYSNPHNPPPGGFPPVSAGGRMIMSNNGMGVASIGAAGLGATKWGSFNTGANVNSKSVEIQRSQADEMFKNLRSGEDLEESEPPEGLVRTALYPHQKKALTFLLEREQERPGASKLWSFRTKSDGVSRAWVHLVTNKEVMEEPVESKSSLLADDMGLGKTITCVSLIASTLDSARAFGATKVVPPLPPLPTLTAPMEDLELQPAHFQGTVWGMPPMSFSAPTSTPDYSNLSAKQRAKLKSAEKHDSEHYMRLTRIKVRSRATLIICPLSTVANWEDQFKEHWGGEVVVVGGNSSGGSGVAGNANGAGKCSPTKGQTMLSFFREKSEDGMTTPGATPMGSEPSLPMGVSITSTSSSAHGLFRPSTPKTTHTTNPTTSPSPPLPSQSHPFRIYIYHGNARRPDPNFLADFDAVITTYATLASEYSKQLRSISAVKAVEDGCSEGSSALGDEDDDECGGGEDENGNGIIRLVGGGRGKARSAGSMASVVCGVKRKKCMKDMAEVTSPLQMVDWFRVVLDEAHSIKETSTVASRASCDLIADRRLCLTGTPVQNKLDDVYALVKFLRVQPLDDKTIWTEYIGGPVKFGQKLGVVRLQTLMKCLTLRRTKESKSEDGKNILCLPPRRDELRYLRFDENEKAIYDGFFQESKAEFNELSNKNEVMKNYVGILQKILRLRQICDHFALVQGKDGFGETGKTIDEVIKTIEKDGINLSSALAMFTLLRESGTSQCVECGYDLGAQLENNTDATIGAEPTDGSSLPPTKRPRKNKAGMGSGSGAGTRQSSPSIIRSILTRCQHLFCPECFRHHVCPSWPDIVNDEERPCFACQTVLHLNRDVIEFSPEAANNVQQQQKRPPKAKRVKGQTTLDPANFNPSTKVKVLLHDLIESSKLNPYSSNYDPEVLMVDANGNQTDDNIIKTVVFSQWTSMLDKIEEGLDLVGIQYDRLDGTMKREDRARAMDELKYNKSCEVLLVSLRAGGVGLNLTAAQRVYLMDPYWNPAVENQAVDRIHRLGQKKPVTTIKLIIEGTIEARLLEVQKKKTELANLTLAGTTFSKAEQLQRRMEELSELFDL